MTMMMMMIKLMTSRILEKTPFCCFSNAFQISASDVNVHPPNPLNSRFNRFSLNLAFISRPIL
ncbi:hypothetical protein BLOT_003484 [Blomia tropicalis]|nr:hypothetical protein BLOT_003484 [Blomia tropicalis]